MKEPQLFNVRQDVGQCHNVAPQHPRRVQRMEKAVREIREGQ